ncbi:hypothetical protein SAMN02982917_0205 [Azospirillum oryzae]|uniref:Uncharacterized protein n=1 Tax=Azospirillum oryzae TaxID=286727 RepID=A0A1X7HQX5_9PROT|nr:hypothetical protein [Azospirillum oryzae]SMF91354.1 hypothetical protein SAMN02982917_0205 [Azospirillum oryzae]
MDTEYELELRRRLEILKTQMADGRVKFLPHVFESIKDSMLAVRYGLDGQIDLSTVDASVRALAMTVTVMKDREDAKKAVSLHDLQRGYFETIEVNFGRYHRIMVNKKLTPHDVARSISNNQDLVEEISSSFPDFLNWVEKLWESASDIASIHIEDTRALKAVFGGDLFPSNQRNIASSCGVYVDTIVLPDPFIRTKMFLTSDNKSKAVYYLIKHALNLLNYKELALADVNPPMVVVVPDRSLIEQSEDKLLADVSEQDTITHVNRLFRQTFSTIDDAMDFVKPLLKAEQAIRAVKDRSRVLFDTELREPLEQQLQEYLDEYLSPLGYKHAGQALVLHAAGRMRQANDVLLRSRYLGGVPLIDAPTSWKYFQWKLEYDAGKIDHDNMVNLHLSKALQTAADGEMTWLGNVPPVALVEMRKVGAISELRQMLSAGVAEMVETNPSNFHRTSDQVIHNLQSAFDAHRKELAALKGKKWRFAGIDLGTCVVRGAVEIASACGVPVVSLIKTALEEVVDAPKIKEIPERYRQLKEEDKRLKRSPVGILFRHQK